MITRTIVMLFMTMYFYLKIHNFLTKKIKKKEISSMGRASVLQAVKCSNHLFLKNQIYKGSIQLFLRVISKYIPVKKHYCNDNIKKQTK